MSSDPTKTPSTRTRPQAGTVVLVAGAAAVIAALVFLVVSLRRDAGAGSPSTQESQRTDGRSTAPDRNDSGHPTLRSHPDARRRATKPRDAGSEHPDALPPLHKDMPPEQELAQRRRDLALLETAVAKLRDQIDTTSTGSPGLGQLERQLESMEDVVRLRRTELEQLEQTMGDPP